MDEPKLPIFPPDPGGPVGADAAPVPGDDRHAAISNQKIAANRDRVETPADPLRENSHVVYCDNEEELSLGFAIALRIMGLKQSQ